MKWIDERIIGFDFETSGTKREYALQPWRVDTGDAWPTSLVWKQGDETVSVEYPTKSDCEAMLDAAIACKGRVVGWNITFDIAWLVAMGLKDKVLQVQWLDGMLIWRHYFIEPEYENRHNRKSYGLKACVAENDPDKAGYEEGVDFAATDLASRQKRLAYNVDDVEFTLSYARKYWLLLTDRQRRCVLLEARSLPHAAIANYEGMLIDEPIINELRQHLTDEAAELLAELEPHGVTEDVVRSPKKLADVLFNQWGLPVYKTSASDNPSTDAESLHELSFIDERAALVKSYREALGNRKKFAETPLEAAHYNNDSRARPEAKVFGTYSGRFTYASAQGRNKDKRQTGFALHQEKRDAMYRNIVIAPKGHTIVEFDAAGQEFRWMAIASNDKTMLNLCMPGEDPHSFMGAQISHVDYAAMMENVHSGDKKAKDGRQLGKVANLSLQYRTSARKLRSVARVKWGMPMEMPEAETIHATYQRAYPGVPLYWNAQIDETKRRGYVETFAGRRVQVVGDWDGDWGWSMGSTSINYRIQGTGAEQKYLAVACLEPLMKQLDTRFAWDLHDGLYFYVPDDHVSRFVVQGRKVLDHLPYKKAWDFTPPIPMPWDCKVGKSWGSLKEVSDGEIEAG